MVKNQDDIIEDIFAAVIEMAPQFKAELQRIAKAKREEWGGDRIYIPRRAGEGLSERNAAIRRDYQNGERIALLERRYQIKRSRLWQIISAG